MSIILGLSGGYFHDSAAAIVCDGHLVAFVEEERLSRRKHNLDSRSCVQSTKTCLEIAGLTINDIDAVSISWTPGWPAKNDKITDRHLIRELLNPFYFKGKTFTEIIPINHHISHAASSFYLSGFENAAVLVIDGSGDGWATSILHGTKKGLRVIESYDYTQSLGWMYENIADYLGLGDWQSSGKLMGLAPYGVPKENLSFCCFEEDQPYFINLDSLNLTESLYDKYSDYNNLKFYWLLKDAYRKFFCDSGINQLYPQSKSTCDAEEFSERHKNLAATAQHILEFSIERLAKRAMKLTGETRLCLAGGVALNCKANGHVWQQVHPSDLYVQPASCDSGGAIGCAFELAMRLGDEIQVLKNKTAYFGPEFTDAQILSAILKSGLEFTKQPDIAAYAAEKLAEKNVIGWYQGKMEGGPRALGNRSILADPRDVEIKDKINTFIKNRERWRPFGPSILIEHLSDYITTVGPADFMIVAYQATKRAQQYMPAAVHVDGTIRPQAVCKDTNNIFHSLISRFYDITGVPAVLNTSYNKNNEPIVCTPEDAIRSFCSMPLDILCIGNYSITKIKR